jgi:hypothetical protein
MATTQAQVDMSADFTEILSDPIFTPALKDQIQSVQDFQKLTEQFVSSVVAGIHPHAILQGPPGLGKSYAVTQALKAAGKTEHDDYIVIKGHITPLQLYATLYMYRRPGQIVVLDDCDEILTKEAGLEVLKAACDADYRRVTWVSSSSPVINGTAIKEFIFNGTVIVCSNIAVTTGRGGRRDRSAAAFLSRLVYWDLRLGSRERMYAQIFNLVVNADYLARTATTRLTLDAKRDMLKFILEHLDEIVSLDLRMPQKVAAEINANPTNWRKTARHLITHGV